MTMTPELPKYANSDAVAVAYLRALLGWTGNVANDLPAPENWDGDLFVQVATLGGTPEAYTPMEHPVLDVKCWSRTSTSSRRSPWPAAANLAMAIRRGILANLHKPCPVQLPAGYPAAHVTGAQLLTTARRIPGDASSYALYSFDLQMHWKQVD